jgi:PAS domain S-box-containing protein
MNENPRSRRLARKVEAGHDLHAESEVVGPERSESGAKGEFLQLSAAAFFELDRAGRIRKVNEPGAVLLGFRRGWLRGKSFVVFVARQDVERFLKVLRESIRDSEPHFIDLDVHVGQNTLPVHVSVKTTGNGAAIAHQLRIADSTDLAESEDSDEESLEYCKTLLHCAPDILMTVDARGGISFVNKPIWGYSVKALIGTHILDHLPQEERHKLQTCLDRAFRFNKSSACEVTGVSGQEDAWFLFTIGAPDSHSGNPRPFARKITTLAIRDISHAKRLEDNLRYSKEQLSDLAGRLETAREEERRQLARELHDDLGQALTVLKLELSMILNKRANKVDIQKMSRTMMTHVEGMLERVKGISLELRPMVMLEELGLLAAVQWQLTEFSKHTGIHSRVLCAREILSLPPEASRAAFRVIQEALTNVMRHADASRVEIRVELREGGLSVVIADNGKGMTRAQESDFKSLGIIGMRERVSRLHGDFNIESEPGKGTQLFVFIPIPREQLRLPFLAS